MQMILSYNEEFGIWENLRAIYPIRFSEKIDRELDGGLLNTLGDGRKKPFTKVRIMMGDTNQDVRTFSFYANSSNEWNASGVTQNCLRLVEPTKELQGVFLDGLSVVQPLNGTQKTLKDVVNRLLAVTPLKKVGGDQKYILTTEQKIVDILERTISPEFQWSSQTSLFEALMDIGNTIDAIPRLVFATNGASTITFDLVGEEKERVNTLAYYGKLTNFDENQYCTELESNVSNLTTKEEFSGTVFFPSENAFIKPRTNDVRLTDQNCKIITNKRINELSRLWIDADNIVVRYLYDAPSGSSEGDTLKRINLKTGKDINDGEEYIEPRKAVDISYYVKEYDDWLTQDYLFQSEIGQDATGEQLSKNNTIYWTRYTNEVTLINTVFSIGVTGLFSDSVFGLLMDSWGKYMLPQIVPSSITALNNLGQTRTCVFDGLEIASNNDPRDFSFQVEYIPIEEESKVRSKKSVTDNAFGFVQPYNQRAETNSAAAFGNNMQGLVNKMGVDYLTTTVRVREWANVRKIGDIYIENGNEYIVTSIDYNIVSADTIECVYTLSKDWNYLSQYFNIDKKFRSWSIPNRIVQRNLYWADVCRISTENTNAPNTSSLRYYATVSIANTFKNTDVVTPLNNCWIENKNASGDVLNRTVLQSSSFVLGNSICLLAKTKDNLSAGIYIEKSDDENQYCKDAFYCSKDGGMEQGSFIFAREIGNADEELFPLATPDLGKNTPFDPLVEVTNVDLQKESTECLAMNYQLFFEPASVYTIVGQGLAENCGLASFVAGGANEVWGLKKRLPKMARLITTDYGELTQGTVSASVQADQVVLNVTLPNASEYVGWAVAVGDKLVIAQQRDLNGNLPTTLYFSFEHKN